jgi:ribosomal protein L7/L12
MLTETATDNRAQLISDAIAFMQSIVRHYGEDRGMAMWERMADSCDPALKGEVFIAMLTGQFSGRITLHGVGVGANAVACIKAIRSVDRRRLGLKEAKDMYDGLKFSGKSAIIEVESNLRGRAAQELRAAGFEL